MATWSKYEDGHALARTVVVPSHLMVKCSSFPPYVLELMERDYPNRLLAASRDPIVIECVARLAVAHAMAACASPGDLCECGHARSAHSLAPACHFGWVSPRMRLTQDGCPCERWRPIVVAQYPQPVRPRED